MSRERVRVQNKCFENTIPLTSVGSVMSKIVLLDRLPKNMGKILFLIPKGT